MSLPALQRLFMSRGTIEVNPFDAFRIRLDDFHGQNLAEKSIATLSDVKAPPTKTKGDLFETLCVQYLKHIYKCDTVWLWKDIPEAIRMARNLPNQDLGIDCIGIKQNEIYAIQCKYRIKPRRAAIGITTSSGRDVTVRLDKLGWRDLSTFYALAERTGPWNKLIVMTTAEGIRRAGGRSNNDISICLGTWRGLSVGQWYELLEIKGNTLGDPVGTVTTSIGPNLDNIRALRLARFG